MSDNMGAGHARNLSIELARGQYIAFCDSDDTWLPEKLEKQIAFMKKNANVASVSLPISSVTNQESAPVSS